MRTISSSQSSGRVASGSGIVSGLSQSSGFLSSGSGIVAYNQTRRKKNPHKSFVIPSKIQIKRRGWEKGIELINLRVHPNLLVF